MPQLSVLVPCVPRRVEQVLPYAGLVRWTSAARLWQGQSMLVEPHHGFVAAAGAGFRVPTGIGVSLMPLRHPYEAALQARSVALATGESVIAGFGPGSLDLQRHLLGEAYPKPLRVAREYVAAVRGLLTGEVTTVEGDHLTMTAQLAPAVAPKVEVGLGVLRPGMARLAGEVADASISWLTPPDYLREVIIPAIDRGVDRAGGDTRPRVVAMVPTVVQHDDTDPEKVALASNAAHFAAPHYQDMLRRAGVDIKADDVPAVARGAIEAGAVVTGDLDTVLKRIRAYAEAGVDEVVLNTTGVHKVHGGEVAIRDLNQILRAHELDSRPEPATQTTSDGPATTASGTEE